MGKHKKSDGHLKKKEKKKKIKKHHGRHKKHKKRKQKRYSSSSSSSSDDKHVIEKYVKEKKRNSPLSSSSSSLSEIDTKQYNKKKESKKSSIDLEKIDVEKNKKDKEISIKSNDYDFSQPGTSSWIPEKPKSDESSSSSEEEDSFSYLIYKRDLNKVFTSFDLIEDVDEFWLFVKQFETKEKEIKRPKNDDYDRMRRINFTIDISNRELFARVSNSKELTQDRLQKFKDIITLYLDFKQQETFGKLRKLRQEQANLPVAQFKNDILEAVKNERVVIIAGDTGCGKSTQVPQYLYASGFGKIGKFIQYLTCIIINK